MSRGVPSPATLPELLIGVFQNEILRENNTQTIVTFSKVKLSDVQKKSLIYAGSVIPIDFFIVYQTDTYLDSKLISTALQLVSFVTKKDGFIYGVYFDVFSQERFSPFELSTSKSSISLSELATFVTSKYLEVYNNVVGTVVILGLSTLGDTPYASLQYSHCHKYYYETLTETGIPNTHIPKTVLSGLSANLRCV